MMDLEEKESFLRRFFGRVPDAFEYFFRGKLPKDARQEIKLEKEKREEVERGKAEEISELEAKIRDLKEQVEDYQDMETEIIVARERRQGGAKKYFHMILAKTEKGVYVSDCNSVSILTLRNKGYSSDSLGRFIGEHKANLEDSFKEAEKERDVVEVELGLVDKSEQPFTLTYIGESYLPREPGNRVHYYKLENERVTKSD